MKLSLITLISAVATLTLTANELPPSDVTPHDLLSPSEHAALYINLVQLIHNQLIPLQDSVTDKESAARVARRVEALHSRRNLAISHMLNNPDMRREIEINLRANPKLESLYRQAEQRFIDSYMRCRATGLISSHEFNRAVNFLPKNVSKNGQ